MNDDQENFENDEMQKQLENDPEYLLWEIEQEINEQKIITGEF